MTNAKLFAKLRALIEDATKADKKHIKKIRKVLSKLKQRQNILQESLSDADNLAERTKIEQEIKVITLQRSKGVEIYKELKNARKLAKQGKSKDTSGAMKADDAGTNPKTGH